MANEPEGGGVKLFIIPVAISASNIHLSQQLFSPILIKKNRLQSNIFSYLLNWIEKVFISAQDLDILDYLNLLLWKTN